MATLSLEKPESTMNLPCSVYQTECKTVECEAQCLSFGVLKISVNHWKFSRFFQEIYCPLLFGSASLILLLLDPFYWILEGSMRISCVDPHSTFNVYGVNNVFHTCICYYTSNLHRFQWLIHYKFFEVFLNS